MWTGKDGNFCAAKAQNFAVFLLIFVKLMLSGVTIAGHTFQVITLEVMEPYLVLMGVTMTGYVGRSWQKAKYNGKQDSASPPG
jgi:hypothetical protein